MIVYLSERENLVEQVNSLCQRLFDAWCETRSVTALAYLMHCWPLSDSTPVVLRRLGETLRELRRNHADRLDGADFQALCDMADLIDKLVGRPSRTVSLKALGEMPETTGK
ncbi:hypothetical protein [Paraburkholderia caribensis]|uniref:hypothetical protein n=1 Tax=Paraburkholderia caribensis TaxID=75105 RepID=UPI0034D1B911